jgi:hypothetical protein
MVYPHVQYQGRAHAERLQVASPTIVQELDSRSSDGIQVRLLWYQGDERVSVAVEDLKTGDQFELIVRDGERALDVFHHPYAYAGLRHENVGGPFATPTDTAIAS